MMRDLKIIATLASIYLILFAAVVAHLIFDLDVQFVWIFCWQVDRLTIFGLTLAFLAIAYTIQLLLSIFSTKHLRNWIVWLHIASGLILITGITLLYLILNSNLISENRLVFFDTTLILVVAAWSIEFYIQLRLNLRGG